MKSPNARREYAYGPPVCGNARPSRAKTSASIMAPAAVTTQPRMLMPPKPASELGSRKIPEPIMLPMTSAVAIQVPRPRRFGAAGPAGNGVVDMALSNA